MRPGTQAGRRTFANNYNYAVIVKLQLKAEERQIEREEDRDREIEREVAKKYISSCVLALSIVVCRS